MTSDAFTHAWYARVIEEAFRRGWEDVARKIMARQARLAQRRDLELAELKPLGQVAWEWVHNRTGDFGLHQAARDYAVRRRQRSRR